MVLVERVVEVGEHNGERGVDEAMLHHIVEQHNLNVASVLLYAFYSFETVVAYRHGGIGEFVCHHCRLVAEYFCRVAAVVELVAFALAAVAAAYHGSVVGLREVAQYMFHVGGLARAAKAEVPNAYGGDVWRLLRYDTEVKQQVAYPHHYAVPHSKWEKEIGEKNSVFHPYYSFDNITACKNTDNVLNMQKKVSPDVRHFLFRL